MKRMWRIACAAGLFALALNANPTRAQIGGAPAPAAVAPAAAGAAPAAAAGAAEAKPGFFMKMCKTLDECRRFICKTPAGQMLNSMTRPVSGFTGGVIPSFCPAMPSDKDLAQPGVAGAADAAKKDALEAKMRREKVRFLGTLDCRYYPDAIGALVAALRMDSSECVRYEAALGLGHGCCCNQKTIDALEASVSGTDKDGNPAERSARVRCAAAVTLERCLACYTPPPPEEEPKKNGGEKPPSDKTPEVTPDGKKPDTLPTPGKLPVDPKAPDADGKSAKHSTQPDKATIERALRTLNEFNALLAAAQAPVVTQANYTTPGRQSVYHILKATADEMPAVYAMPRPVTTPTTPPAAPTAPTLTTSQMTPAKMAPSQPAPTQMAPAQPAAVLGPPLVPTQPTQSPEPAKAPAPAPVLVPAPVTTPTAPPAAAMPPRETTVKPAAAVVTPPQPRPVAPPMPSIADEVNKCASQVLYAPTPADRHVAIRQLVKYDWKQHPVAVAVLLTGAKTDANNVVRVDCLRHMVAYRMSHPQVLVDLTAMTADADPWVRQEAAEALTQLKQVP